MQIREIIAQLEQFAPPALQESYDNAGLLTGRPDWECTGMLCCLDATEEVVEEAIAKGINLVVAHHPIVFGGLKKINGKNYVEQTIIRAIKNDIALYAIHTNLDNVMEGVNARIAAVIGLQQLRILAPKEQTLRKLITFVPHAQADTVRNALFAAGGGMIGQYSECSFNSEGTGTFRAAETAQPFAGERGVRHSEPETRLEMVFPATAQASMLSALFNAHPYEEVAYDIINLANPHPGIGAGMVGELPEPMQESAFLALLRDRFSVPVVRHTAFTGRPVKKVALCGGAGSSLISKALNAGADCYVTADLKYHEFFDANGKMLLADIGHYESEQFTTELLFAILTQKFPTFAVLKTGVKTNPVRYFL